MLRNVILSSHLLSWISKAIVEILDSDSMEDRGDSMEDRVDSMEDRGSSSIKIIYLFIDIKLATFQNGSCMGLTPSP